MKRVVSMLVIVAMMITGINIGIIGSHDVKADVTNITVENMQDLKEAAITASNTHDKYIFILGSDILFNEDDEIQITNADVTIRGNGHTISVEPSADVDTHKVFIRVVGDATLNLGIGSYNNRLTIKSSHHGPAPDYVYRNIPRIDVASTTAKVNIYKGSTISVGFNVAGELNMYGGALTNFSGRYLERNGIQIDNIIQTYSGTADPSKASINIYAGTLSHNAARPIYVEGDSTCTVRGASPMNQVIFENNVLGADGVAILFESKSTLDIENTLFRENQATAEPKYRPEKVGFGEAICATNGKVNISYAAFEDNTQAEFYSYYYVYNSVIYIKNAKLSMDNCRVSNNKDGIRIEGDKPATISNTLIKDNSGSGLFLRDGVICNLVNTKIEGNKAPEGAGACINITDPYLYGMDDAPEISKLICDSNTVICNNVASITGSDIYGKNCYLELPNALDMDKMFNDTGYPINGWYVDGVYPSLGIVHNSRYSLGDFMYEVTEFGYDINTRNLIAAYRPKEETTYLDETTSSISFESESVTDETISSDITTDISMTETQTTGKVEIKTTKDDFNIKTTSASEMTKNNAKIGKTKIKKAKKKSNKKLSIRLKRVKNARGYQVAIYKSRKSAIKNKKAILKKIKKKVKFTIKSKKIKRKKLFIRARAFALGKNKKIYGKWSSIKKVRNKK